MECPYCAETIRDEALVCNHCSRDLMLVRPVLLEIQDLVAELDRMQRRLDTVNVQLSLREHPFQFSARTISLYVLPAVALLILAHFLIIVQFNLAPLYLRIASLLIPLPFGAVAGAVAKIGYRGAIVLGAITAVLSIAAMLTVIGLIDDVPIVPPTFLEWREATEYALSITFAFLTGNILALLLFVAIPAALASTGKPSTTAFRIAALLGQHVGEEGLRRRARRIQDLLQTIGPVAGLVASAAGSLYAGLKGMIGN